MSPLSPSPTLFLSVGLSGWGGVGVGGSGGVGGGGGGGSGSGSGSGGGGGSGSGGGGQMLIWKLIKMDLNDKECKWKTDLTPFMWDLVQQKGTDNLLMHAGTFYMFVHM